jgi:multidrug efflux pump subunit AcrB
MSMRRKLPEELPGVRFTFERHHQPGNEFRGADTDRGRGERTEPCRDPPVRGEAARHAGASTHAPRPRFEQELEYPAVKVNVDRERAGVLGVTVNEVANAVVAGTSSSRQVEIPQQRMNSLEEMRNLPIARRSGQQIDLRNIASISDGTALGEYDRYNMQRMLTLSANISGEDATRDNRRKG